MYTKEMETQLTSQKWDYDSATIFAKKHSLSVRSVISKVKSLGLDYTPKPKKVAASQPRVTKSALVSQIASATGGDPEALAGLETANMTSLLELLKSI